MFRNTSDKHPKTSERDRCWVYIWYSKFTLSSSFAMTEQCALSYYIKLWHKGYLGIFKYLHYTYCVFRYWMFNFQLRQDIVYVSLECLIWISKSSPVHQKSPQLSWTHQFNLNLQTIPAVIIRSGTRLTMKAWATSGHGKNNLRHRKAEWCKFS